MPDAPGTLQDAHRLIAAGRPDEARAIVARVLQRREGDHEAHCLMCYLLTKSGEHAAAIEHISRALALRPDEPYYLANLGKLQAMTGQRAAAIATLQRVLELSPGNLNAHIDLAGALESSHRYAAAAAQCERGLAHHPEDPALSVTLAMALLNQGRVERAVARLRRAAAANPDDPLVASALAGAMNYLPGATSEEVFAAHRRFGAVMSRLMPETMPPATPARDPERVLRVGLVSPDFRAHSVASFVEPMLTGLDPGRIHLTCYMTSSAADGTTERFRRAIADRGEAGAWRDVAFVDAAALARQVRADRIDILIDLAGHTRGHRLPTFHLRPAPVQVTYLGYPNTTGLEAMDWRIVDSLTDPAGAEGGPTHTVERLLRLDPCFLCYTPPADAPAVALPPSASSARITFGSFNSVQKLNGSVIEVWSRLLLAAPGSGLVLKYAGLDEEESARAILDRFASHGVDPSRIDLLGRTPAAADHLAAYGRIDIALDTFPYNGTTTTCEALYMGVPVVTLAGRMHAGRVGASLLRAVGDERLSGLVAASEEEYITTAVALAGDPARLASLRADLRPALLRSPLCDRAAFLRHAEAALREMWRDFCTRPQPARPPALPPPPAPLSPATPLAAPTPAAAPALRDAMAHLHAGRAEQALNLLMRAAQRWPTDAAVVDSLATLLIQRGDAARAVYYAEQGLRAHPHDPGLLLTLGHALILTQQGERAIGVLERAVANAPDWPEPRSALAGLHQAESCFASAAAVAGPAVEAHPGNADAAMQLSAALLCMGRAEEAVAVLRRAAERVRGDVRLLGNIAFTLNYDPDATPRDRFEAHIAFGAALHRSVAPHILPPLPPSPAAADNRPLRLGLLSPDLRSHAVASFVEPALRHLDRSAFEVTCYYTGTTEDRVSARLRALSHRWRHDLNPDQARLARQIRADGIDILIELSGLTAQNRLPVPAMRPAPVQMTWIGYPNTTGLSAIGWRIVDSITDPPGTEDLAAETLLRLDPCFLCYAPPEEAPVAAALPPSARDPAAGITFGCLGSLLKVNRRVLAVWARLLRGAPGSRLLLKNHGLTQEQVRDDLAARFEALGIERERLLLLAPTPGIREHLATYDRIDISLDTFPYTGTTTTCESLLMGVPVVTMAGESHLSRVGISLLAAAGMGEDADRMIANDEDGYVRAAAALAADRAALTDLRRTLRGRFLASPLCDGPAFAARLGTALRTVWRERCAAG